jgi:hypothetical protein
MAAFKRSGMVTWKGTITKVGKVGMERRGKQVGKVGIGVRGEGEGWKGWNG